MTDEQSQGLADLLGVSFLAYVLSLSEGEIAARLKGTKTLDPDGEDALADVLAHAAELGSDRPFGITPALPDGSSLVRMRRFGWTDLDRDHTHANLFRLATGGVLPEVPDGMSAAETAIAEAAIEYYPITLLSLEQGKAFLPPKPLISRKHVRALEAALANDPIKRLFAPGTVFYTSSGMGYGALMTYRVAECALATAEQRVRMLTNKSPASFISEATDNLRRMRELVESGSCAVPTVVGFWNVEMPADVALAGPRRGLLRPARDSDPHVPMAARATVALDTTCEVGLHVGAKPPPAGSRFWTGVERLVVDEQLVSLAALLAGPGADGELALPVLAWTQVFDPFQPYVGRFLPAPSGPPTVPFPAERLAELEQWIGRLDCGYHPSIRVAISRTLSAVTERGLSDDALIDYVIALENLFGGPGPKLEIRISNALAAVLGKDREQEADIAERSRCVYRARSKLVHGDELPEMDQHLQDQAQLLLLDALRVLFTTHTKLLADRKARRQLGTKRPGVG